MRRIRTVTVDGKNAIAFVLGTKLVVATGEKTIAKDGTSDDLAKLDSKLKNADLQSSGFQEVK